MRFLIVMGVTALSAPAYAQCTVHATPGLADFTSLQTAVNSCSPADLPILLLSDLTEDVDIAANTSIDGNGMTLTGTGADSVIEVTAGVVDITALTVTGGVSTDFGGGLRALAGTSITLSNVEITDNRAPFGGGVGTEGDLSIMGGSVHLNTATNSGGGIAARRSGARPTVTLSDTLIEDNEAANNGGGAFFREALVLVTNTKVSLNEADNGGGLYLETITSTPATRAILTTLSSSFDNNAASVDGGAFYIAKGLVSINRGRVYDNVAGDRGGGLVFEGDELLAIINSTVSANDALNEGGGLWLDGDGAQTLEFLTIVDNTAPDGDQIFSTAIALTMTGSALGETGMANASDDCVVTGGSVFGTTSRDGTCVTGHVSNQISGLSVGGASGLYLPTAGSALQGFVPGAFCPTGDQLGAGRASPCDGGAVEN